MTEFERQLTARLQAQEFLIHALLRDYLSKMSPSEATTTMAQLETEFATLVIPYDSDPNTDLTELMDVHSDAQSLLAQSLDRANPHRFEQVG